MRKGAIRQSVKPEDEAVNRLCDSCRRNCKQPSQVIIASCPRYYMGTRNKRSIWTQMELSL